MFWQNTHLCELYTDMNQRRNDKIVKFHKLFIQCWYRSFFELIMTSTLDDIPTDIAFELTFIAIKMVHEEVLVICQFVSHD
jgi:hypothetical protein